MVDLEKSIKALVARLKARGETETLANPYATHDPRHDGRDGAACRRRNLELYLTRMAQLPIRILLVGEAAGYQGCRFSGIAFTSEFTLANHAFFAGGSFVRSGARERLWKEPSGSIVWEVSARMSVPPVLWNIVPFHPHKPDSPLSNRTPTRGERDEGLGYLLDFRAIFPRAHVVCAGRIPSETLSAAGIEHTAVRHPAYGGKAEFQAGLLAAAQRLEKAAKGDTIPAIT